MTLEVKADGETDVGTIMVGEARHIAGLVVDADGRPVTRVPVFVLDASGATTWVPNDLEGMGAPPEEAIVTDESGRFESNAIVAGRYVVAARSRAPPEGIATLTAPFEVGATDVRDVRVAFPALGGIVRVTARARGQPSPNAALILLHEGGERMREGADEHGVCELRFLRVGRWQVAFQCQGSIRAVGPEDEGVYERPTPAAAWKALREIQGTTEIVVATGADASVAVEGPPLVNWTGSVRMEGDSAVPEGISILPTGSTDEASAVEFVLLRGGRFDFSEISPGEYDVTEVRDDSIPKRELAHARVTIPDVPTFEHDLVLRRP